MQRWTSPKNAQISKALRGSLLNETIIILVLNVFNHLYVRHRNKIFNDHLKFLFIDFYTIFTYFQWLKRSFNLSDIPTLPSCEENKGIFLMPKGPGIPASFRRCARRPVLQQSHEFINNVLHSFIYLLATSFSAVLSPPCMLMYVL